MEFKKIIYKLLLSITFLPLLVLFVGSVQFPTDKFYLLMILFGYGVSVLLHENVLAFLTVPKVFVTRTLVISILSFGFLYFARATVPGFLVDKLIIKEATLGSITIAHNEFSEYATIITISVLTALLYNLFLKLRT